MAYRPRFRQPEEEIEKSLEQKLAERTKAIEEKVQAAADAASKATMEQFEEREAKKRETEEQRLHNEQKMKEEIEEKAQKLAEEKAQKLAEEKAQKLAEEKAQTLAEEKAQKLVEERVRKLTEEQRLQNEQKMKEEAQKLAEEKAQKLAEERVQKLTEEQKSREESSKMYHKDEPKSPETSTKIAKMIEEIKKRKAASPDISSQQTVSAPTVPSPNITLVSPDKIIDDKDAIDCPTCHGHIHSMETDGVSYKCTGTDCGKEYVMIDKASDYKCAGCGAPIKRPETEKLKIDSCPFCKSKKAVKFDWGKLWKVQKAPGSAK